MIFKTASGQGTGLRATASPSRERSIPPTLSSPSSGALQRGWIPGGVRRVLGEPAIHLVPQGLDFLDTNLRDLIGILQAALQLSALQDDCLRFLQHDDCLRFLQHSRVTAPLLVTCSSAAARVKSEPQVKSLADLPSGWHLQWHWHACLELTALVHPSCDASPTTSAFRSVFLGVVLRLVLARPRVAGPSDQALTSIAPKAVCELVVGIAKTLPVEGTLNKLDD